MRINKYLALCGLGSRRKCEEFVVNGEISINNKKITNLATEVNLKTDKVYYKENLIEPPTKYVYYKLNKPKGYICTAKDDRDRKTIFSLINSDVRLFSVGRLDYHTEGLILLTNDGEFAEKIAHPSYEIEKEYIVKIEGEILESELAVLRAGVVENGIRMPKAKVTLLSYKDKISRLSVKINEGQNHQVRRMFSAIDKTITLLKRVSIGKVKLGGLKRGEYKPLTIEEYESLMRKKCE